MQAIAETIFDVLYLSSVTIIGITMMRKANGNNQYFLFGLMAVILGCGDAFHLVPRCYSLFTSGLEANAASLGIGKFITSITMTIFYVILYYIYRMRYHVKEEKGITVTIYLLAIIRIVLCLFPQNEWLLYNANLTWGIIRNIPFALIGIIIIYLFFKKAKEDKGFTTMWFAIVLSFAFYAPVVLFGNTYPLVGMLMIPKTLAYVWIVWMGYKEMLSENK
ncbi:MAG: hypothetical protein RR863_06270 [Erysipelotrichaceae bacterium]